MHISKKHKWYGCLTVWKHNGIFLAGMKYSQMCFFTTSANGFFVSSFFLFSRKKELRSRTHLPQPDVVFFDLNYCMRYDAYHYHQPSQPHLVKCTVLVFYQKPSQPQLVKRAMLSFYRQPCHNFNTCSCTIPLTLAASIVCSAIIVP